MDKPSLSPSSSDSSDEECEVLTPAQRDSAATPPAAGPPPAPADTINHPAPEVPKIDAEFVKARFGEYMRKVEKKKDIKGKAKNSSIKASSPLASQSGIGAPAPAAATFPSTSIHKAVIIAQLLNNHLILEWFLLLTPCHGPQEDHLVALKDSPDSQIPSQGSRALICHSNQQFPTGLLNQRTALPYQGFGVTPPAMDRHWSFNQPQHG